MSISPPTTGNASSLDRGLAELVEELTAKIKAKEPDDLQACCDAHPEHAKELRNLFPALQLLADLSRPSLDGSPHYRAEQTDLSDHGVLGDYRILREVGRGGMGVVYEAEQISLKRRVALKVLPFAATMDPRQLVRFQNEARAAASLEHPHIVPVYAVGCERGVHYYAMKFIEGQTVAALIAQQRTDANPAEQPTQSYAPPSAQTSPRAQERTAPLPRDAAYFRRAAEWGIQAAEALEHAHSFGIVHRDIKPANLMIDGQGKLWVTDFGLARTTTDAGLTMTGDVLGTLRYMSPEQAQANHGLVDHRTDVYSLGVTLYEMLTLRPAFDGEDRAHLLQRICTEEPQAPRRIEKAIPIEFETIILKTIEKSTPDRYASARDLAEDLQRFIHDRPICAKRPTLIQKAARWMRWHRSLMRAAAVFLFVGIIGLAVAFAIVWHEKGLKDKALADKEDALTEAKNSLAQSEENRAIAFAEFARAETNLKTAEQQAAITSAINDFLRDDLLGQADLRKQTFVDNGTKRNRNITVGELLDRAAERIDGKFDGQPLTEAGIRVTLGEGYRALGRYAEATKHLQKSVDLRVAFLGLDHIDTLYSKYSLAVLKSDAGEYPAAEELFNDVLDRRTNVLGANNRDTLATVSGLADLYLKQGKKEKSKPLMEKVLKGQVSLLGEVHLDTLTTKSNLALVYYAENDYKRAARLYEDLREAAEKQLGHEHPDVFGIKNNLGTVYKTLREFDAAERLFKEVLEYNTKSLGDDHPNTLSTKNNLAALYMDRRDFDKAESMLNEVLAVQIEKLPSDHPTTLITKTNLAVLYSFQGKADKAMELYKQVIAGQTAKLGASHPSTLSTKISLANFCTSQSRFADAEPLLREFADVAKQRSGPDSLQYAGQLAQLGLNYLNQKKGSDAEEVMQECLRIRRQKEPDAWTTFNAQSMLGEALLLQKDYAKAEATLLEGYKGMKEREEKMPADSKKVRLPEALERLVGLYEGWEKKDEAAKWREELELTKAVKDNSKQ
jgi:serine/threonine protein kinase/Tfp pilus assembly protein PilF